MANDFTTITLVLTGARAGKTCVLGGRQFIDGEHVVQGQLSKLGGLVTYFARVYAAFPKGSVELAQLKEQSDGEADTHTAAAGGQADAVRSDVHTDGAAHQAATVGTDGGDGDAAPEHGTEGDGHQDARLRSAVMGLDPTNDEHWTSDGRPRMDAVESKFGSAGITRKDVERVAPGFVRPQ